MRIPGNKYGAHWTVCPQGHRHQSKIEAIRCSELHLMLRAHNIFALTIQPRFLLAAGFKHDGKTYRASYYVGDFFYVEAASIKAVCEDVKAISRKTGKPISTALFKHKWKEAIRLYPDIIFRIYADAGSEEVDDRQSYSRLQPADGCQEAAHLRQGCSGQTPEHAADSQQRLARKSD